MASLSKDDVLKLARLARLQISGEEAMRFSREFTDLLAYVEQLQKVDVSGLEPTYQVTGLKNVMRPDEEWDYGASPQDLLKNAPSVEQGQFKVKRMVG